MYILHVIIILFSSKLLLKHVLCYDQNWIFTSNVVSLPQDGGKAR